MCTSLDGVKTQENTGWEWQTWGGGRRENATLKTGSQRNARSLLTRDSSQFRLGDPRGRGQGNRGRSVRGRPKVRGRLESEVESRGRCGTGRLESKKGWEVLRITQAD